MKILINKRGNLYLKRSGRWKSQYCPFSVETEQVPCGDWCPHFKEPTFTTEKIVIDNESNTIQIKRVRVNLSLCHGAFLCISEEDFTDEREEALETDV